MVPEQWVDLEINNSLFTEDEIMKLKSRRLDQETQLLVGIGAAVASGCIPCLEKMAEKANQAGIDPKKMRESAIIGQFVKDQPVYHMKEAADTLLGVHLSRLRTQSDCPNDERKEGGGCGCESDNEHESCGCMA